MSTPVQTLTHAAEKWFGKSPEDLSERERRVLMKAEAHAPISQNVNTAFAAESTFGERLADRVAAFGGSWTFIVLFCVVLAGWVGLNLAMARAAFDPYPFIFLNLMLSMVAAIQAPVIMMSQNRQGAKDRADAAHDYEVNLKAEIEIMALHEKMDRMRTVEMEAMLARQAEQIALLTRLVERLDPTADGRTGV